jgi:hypothetical protein
MCVSFSDFEYTLIVVLFFFLFILLNFLFFSIVSLDLIGYSFELRNGLFGDDEFSDDFFNMVVKVALCALGLDVFERLRDGCHFKFLPIL